MILVVGTTANKLSREILHLKGWITMPKATYRFQLQDCMGIGRFIIKDTQNNKTVSNKFKERQEAVKWAFANLNECETLQYRTGKKVYHRKDYPSGQQPTTKELKDLGKKLEKVRELKKEVMKEVIEPLAAGCPAGWEPAYISTHSGNYTVVVGKRSFTFGKSHKNYDKLEKAIKDKDLASFEQNIEPAVSVKKFFGDNVKPGKIEIKDGEITFNGEVVHHVLVGRIFEAMEKGLPHDGLVKFLENLLRNPNKESVEATYQFLENKCLAITNDGYFLAYKKVRENFKDWNSNTVDHSVGTKPSIPREKCDSNRIHSCGYGFHCGSLQYAKEDFHKNDGILLLVKVNPADVVSIPSDASEQKLRTCTYEVMEILEDYRPKPVESEPEVKAELQGDDWDEGDEESDYNSGDSWLEDDEDDEDY